jgi:hypothetical protein
VSPTVFRERGFRFAFYSNEEARVHVHVYHAGCHAKFWLEPKIELAHNSGLRPQHIRTALQLIEENENEIRVSWERHFGR